MLIALLVVVLLLAIGPSPAAAAPPKNPGDVVPYDPVPVLNTVAVAPVNGACPSGYLPGIGPRQGLCIPNPFTKIRQGVGVAPPETHDGRKVGAAIGGVAGTVGGSFLGPLAAPLGAVGGAIGGLFGGLFD